MKNNLITDFEKNIPKKVIYRLSLYQRYLKILDKNNIKTASSITLANASGVKATQLRKDLAHFGQSGVRGVGYDVQYLIDLINKVLGKESYHPVILVGVGNLGSALLSYSGFLKSGFEIIAGFDEKISNKKNNDCNVPILKISDLTQYLSKNNVKMAIIAVPPYVAQSICNTLVDCGVVAILNFSPTVLHKPDHVTVTSVDLAVELENLSYFVK